MKLEPTAQPEGPPKPLTDRDRAIISQWNEGAQASDIAKAYKVSRSSILGILHRARKAGHHVINKAPAGHERRAPKPEAPKRLPRKESTLVPSRQPVSRKALAAAAAGDELPILEVDKQAARFSERQRAMLAPGHELGVPFATSGKSCQWPLWGDDQRTGHVCGAGLRLVPDPKTGELKPREPYCDFHWAKAYPGRK